MHVFCVTFCVVSSSFLFVMEKDGKAFFNAEKSEFDQRMFCKAPVCWLKYTTVGDESVDMTVVDFALMMMSMTSP